jgi:hypothetical protein
MRLTAIGGSIRRLIGSRVAGAGESASLSLSFTTAHDLSLPPPHRHGDISTARTPTTATETIRIVRPAQARTSCRISRPSLLHFGWPPRREPDDSAHERLTHSSAATSIPRRPGEGGIGVYEGGRSAVSVAGPFSDSRAIMLTAVLLC